ncbi:holocarboxylase synthetase-like protein isoform X2 [Musca autumnalis]|uniref:holocarboxylase synthetase-like protein isoform X2 n=1 Tax=Musca autumnalis TaxID=221902 RepID=UPI003CF6F092
MLTLYYVSATFLQSWRINKICQKISEQLSQQATIAFYVLPQNRDEGFYSRLATSEMCQNRQIARVTEILWLHDNNRGCCLMPLQSIPTSAWITFPDAPGLRPFHFGKSPESLQRSLSLDRHGAGLIRLLLETETTPCYDDRVWQQDVVRIENYGKLIAWKIDSHLAVLIETDIEHFTKLLIDTFLQNNLFINDHLPLLRIESVRNDGVPQPYSLLCSHLRKPARSMEECKPDEWSKHLDDLRAVSVLANQAIEYASNKTKTEHKTSSSASAGNSPIKPDLIPQEKRTESGIKNDKESPKKPQATSADSKKLDAGAEKVKQDIKPRTEMVDGGANKENLPSKDASEKLIKAEQAKQNETTTSSPKVVDPQLAKKSSETLEKAASPSKLRAKPTEIKKPGVTDAGRFKTAKTSSEALIEAESKKSSELEKIAASERSKSKSPTKPEEKVSEKKPSSTKEVKQSQKIDHIESPQKHAEKSSEIPKDGGSKQMSTPNKSESTKATASLPKVDIPTTTISATTSDQTQQKSINTIAAATPSLPSTATAIASASPIKDNAKRPSLKRHKDSIKECKPLNVLVYAETATARESAINILKEILAENTYTIYPMTQQQVEQKHWLNSTALLVVCGSVSNTMGELFVDYFLHGGKVLSLCSDVLHFILPTYRTAEVREHELVQFSYDKWQKVKMMHHIFCYQPSPVKKNFSTDSDDSAYGTNRKPSIELKDLKGHLHQLDVKVLGTEETWNTPSLLLATNQRSGGSAVFSQVHLEINPSEFESDEIKYAILKENDKIRHEIFSDLLKKHLSLNVKSEKVVAGGDVSASGPKCVYKKAYFLGKHEAKFDLLQKLKDKCGSDNAISTPNLMMKFCGPDDKLPNVNSNILPILIHSCPEDFSTVEYFDKLKTLYVGRLVIYAPVVSSSQHVITDLELSNGIAVIPRQQTSGVGRSNNQWLSPLGCAMFSIQLHISLNSALGKRLPLVQHIVGAAMANVLKSHEQYKVLNIGLKWPNDTYANGVTKIGGLVVKTTLIGTNAIVNIGCGINLDNGKPTICINDMIREYNHTNQKQLPPLKYEEFLAMIFNEIERLLELVQQGDFDKFYQIYYNLWLHGDQSITICDQDGSKKEAKVAGIDEYGYLEVMLANGTKEVVHPDGNSFDMLKGLIVPKFN